jgi:NAD dependent epimerase/dehydratase family enzyme
MKIKVAVIALLTFTTGFAAGLLGRNLISPANAAENHIILITRDAEIANECNFDKTIVRGNNSTICVRR